MKALIAAEWFKIRKRRLPWILGVCIVGIISLLYLILLIALTTSESEQTFTGELSAGLRVRNTIRFGDGIVYRVVALMSLILAATVVANDYHWRTVVMRVGWTGERVKPFIATLIATSAIACAGLILGFVTTILAVIIIGIVHGTLETGDLGLWLAWDGGLAVIRSLPAVLVFITSAAAIAAWTKSSAAGIAIPLGILFLEPLGAAALAAAGDLEKLTPLMLTRNVDSLLAANGEVIGSKTALPEGLPSAWLAAAFLLCYAALTTAIATRLLARREVTD